MTKGTGTGALARKALIAREDAGVLDTLAAEAGLLGEARRGSPFLVVSHAVVTGIFSSKSSPLWLSPGPL